MWLIRCIDRPSIEWVHHQHAQIERKLTYSSLRYAKPQNIHLCLQKTKATTNPIKRKNPQRLLYLNPQKRQILQQFLSSNSQTVIIDDPTLIGICTTRTQLAYSSKTYLRGIQIAFLFDFEARKSQCRLGVVGVEWEYGRAQSWRNVAGIFFNI